MKRLFFLSPDIESTTAVVADLKQCGVKEKHIHVVAKNISSVKEANLHSANLLQTTDLVHSLEQGAIAGATVGMLAGLAAVSFPILGFTPGGGTVLWLSVFGSVFGAWASSMIGISIPDPSVEKFQSSIDSGELLLIIDFPKVAEQQITDTIRASHPTAVIDSKK